MSEEKIKVPKVLRAILAGAKKELPPPSNNGVAQVFDKGAGGIPVEAGTDTAPILHVSNDGPSALVSMATPFGRPALEPGQQQKVPEPILEMEQVDTEEINPDPEEANDVAEQEAKDMEELDKEIAKEMDEPEKDPFAPPEEPLEQEEPKPDISEVLQELDELRKKNKRLEEKNKILSKKGGAQELIEAMKQEVVEANVRTSKLAQQLKEEQEKPKEQPLPEWQGKDLRILTPFHKTTNPATSYFLLAMALDFGAERIGFIPALGDARIANARNRLADDFLKTGAQWSLWIDDDIIPTVGRPEFVRRFIGATPEEVPDSVLNVHVVNRLMSRNQKIIGATYFGRRKYSAAMFKGGIDDRGAYDKAKRHTGDLIPTDWVATGCLLVHRDVYLGIQRAFPDLGPKGTRTYWDFFQEGEGLEGGEDVMFCKRAKTAGFQPYVDTGAQCFHLGFQAFGFWNTAYRGPHGNW